MREGRRGGRWTRGRWVAGWWVLMFGVALLVACSRPQPPTSEGKATGKPIAVGTTVVAVLPLDNAGNDPDALYFTDGVSRHFARALGDLPGVVVINPESSFRFRGSSELNSVIGDRLGANALLRGSLRRNGEAFTLSMQLVQASDGTALWSKTFERPLRDLFATQDAVVEAVANVLQVAPPAVKLPDDRPPGGSLAAYDTVLRGDAHYRAGDVFAARQAVEAFERAVALEPAWAHAHAWLALARVQQLERFGDLYATEARAQGELARRDAATALRLAPGSADAQRANAAWLSGVAKDAAGAAEALRQALAIRPNDADLRVMLAIRQNGFGQLREAVETLRLALKVNPLSAPTLYSLGSVYLGLADYPQAEHELRLALELEPSMPLVRAFLSMAVFQQNRTAEAIDIAREEPTALWRNYALAMAYWANGNREQSEAALQALVRDHAKDAPTQVAGVYAQRDDREKMFHWLGVARETGDPGLSEIRFMPFIARYADDPRFIAIVRDLELAAGRVPPSTPEQGSQASR